MIEFTSRKHTEDVKMWPKLMEIFTVYVGYHMFTRNMLTNPHTPSHPTYVNKTKSSSPGHLYWYSYHQVTYNQFQSQFLIRTMLFLNRWGLYLFWEVPANQTNTTVGVVGQARFRQLKKQCDWAGGWLYKTLGVWKYSSWPVDPTWTE